MLFKGLTSTSTYYSKIRYATLNAAESAIKKTTDALITGNTTQLSSSSSTLKKIAQSRSIDDIKYTLSALISDNKMEAAEALFQKSLALGKSSSIMDQIRNQFIEAYLRNNQRADAERWLNSDDREKDILGYALFVKYFLKNKELVGIKLLLERLKSINNNNRNLEDKIIEYLTEEEKRVYFEIQRPSTISIFSINSDDNQFVTLNSSNSSSDDDENTLTTNNTLTMNNEEGEHPSLVVKSIQSKSHGIYFIKEALKNLKQGDVMNKYQLQEILERDCIASTISQMHKNRQELYNRTGMMNSSIILPLLDRWMIEMSSLIDNFIDTSTKENDVLYSAILKVLPSEKISLIVLQEINKLGNVDPQFSGVQIVKLASLIGDAIDKEIFAYQIGKKEFLKELYVPRNELGRILHDRRGFDNLRLKAIQKFEMDLQERRNNWIPKMSFNLKIEIGVALLYLVVNNLKLDNGEMAYKHSYAHIRIKKYGIFQLNPNLTNLLLRDKNVTMFIQPTAMPMISPPRPWLTYNSGGYLTSKNYFVRLKDEDYHLAQIHKANSLDQLEKIFNGLDILGKTAWKINETTLKVAVDLWNSGVNVATLEKAIQWENGKVFTYKDSSEFSSRQDYIKYVREQYNYRTELANNHSIMCDTNYKLEIGNQYKGIPFYFPHSVDFRGRAYPIPPYLSHMGSDLSRGLLLFDKGLSLGSRGLRWLKIHLSNKFGVDKCSFDERIAFVEGNMENIIDSAERPLIGNMWWKTAEEPWQCLATCIELANALKSPDPESFVSYFPIQQDGSCNGLQHYAALGRDIDGATSVNLVPNDRPQDIYAEVAKRVNQFIEKDVYEGTGANHEIAKLLIGKINRKIIKQPVMTSVYGVSQYGARNQIIERLKEYKIVDEEVIMKCGVYLSKLTFSGLDSLFFAAKDIQKWFNQTAKEIASSLSIDAAKRFGYAPNLEHLERGEIVKKSINTKPIPLIPGESYPQTEIAWTTPLGFRIVQPYKSSSIVRLNTVLQCVNVKNTRQDDPVDSQKQATAFPPNFIHSLDASHMFMTANSTNDEGIVFASVHDSFWTHAGSADQMNRIIREQFIALHQQPILENLRTEFMNNYGSFKVPMETIGKKASIAKKCKWRSIKIEKLPEPKELDLNLVRNSEYFFN